MMYETRFCEKCGTALIVKSNQFSGRYNAYNGHQIRVLELICPNRIGWFSGHSNNRYININNDGRLDRVS